MPESVPDPNLTRASDQLKRHNRQAIGVAAEDRAALYLQAQGLRLLERNFRVRGGEIDLICQDQATLVFVEVRSRALSLYGSAADSISAKKRARIILAARFWLMRQPDLPCRFDCIVIDAGHLEWIKDAFTAD